MIFRTLMPSALRRALFDKPGMGLFSTLTMKGDMLSRQSELPKQPVPPLRETIERYLKSVKPFVSEAELATTKKLAEELIAPGGVGEKLHRLLEERAAKTDNWLSAWWLEGAYLGYRNPLVVYSSPAMAMPRQVFRSSKDQLAYAASLVQAVLDFKSQIDNETMSTEVQGKAPLDMMQYKNILGTDREPHKPLDKLFHARNSQHIVVAHQGNFYKVTVYDGTEQLETEQILQQLHEVVQDSYMRGKGPQVGILTTRHRDLWADTFANLSAKAKNQQNLNQLRDAIMVLCLDNPLIEKAPWDSVAAKQLLVGGQNGENAGNRWCDKCLQFIVGAEGNVGILYEHSPAEGPPVAALLDFCVKQASIWPIPPQECSLKPEALEFTTNVQIDRDIDSAGKELKKLVNNLELSLYTYENYGKDLVKTFNLSPDSFIQTAIQLAYYRVHKAPGACYETAALRRFLGGRTETIRSCSEESVRFCHTALDNTAKVADKVASLRHAVDAHKKYVNAASSGLGVDRLFFGMKRMAAEVGLEIPRFFFDKSMVVSTHFKLSTSQVAAKSRSVMFYGPLVPDGYGCCYNPGNDYILFGLSDFKDCPTTNLETFRDSLQRSLDEMRDYLAAESLKAKL